MSVGVFGVWLGSCRRSSRHFIENLIKPTYKPPKMIWARVIVIRNRLAKLVSLQTSAQAIILPLFSAMTIHMPAQVNRSSATKQAKKGTIGWVFVLEYIKSMRKYAPTLVTIGAPYINDRIKIHELLGVYKTINAPTTIPIVATIILTKLFMLIL